MYTFVLIETIAFYVSKGYMSTTKYFVKTSPLFVCTF